LNHHAWPIVPQVVDPVVRQDICRQTSPPRRNKIALTAIWAGWKRRSAPWPRKNDAIELLKEDHREVERMFKEFEKASSPDAEKRIAAEICEALTKHAKLEEELFYPEAREAVSEPEMVDEAVVEHNTMKYLIEQIESGELDDDMFRATVTVLKEYVEHHVEEEEKEMFKEVRKADVDTEMLGEQMQQLA
jgi:hypothetical protein